MDLSTFPHTALVVIWESLDDWEACQSLRRSCVTLRNVSDGRIQQLDMDFLRGGCEGPMEAFPRFPHNATLKKLCLNPGAHNEDGEVIPLFTFARLFDSIMGDDLLLARLAGVTDLSLSECKVISGSTAGAGSRLGDVGTRVTHAVTLPFILQITRADLSVACHLCPGLTALSIASLQPSALPQPAPRPEENALPVLRVLTGLRELTLKLGVSAESQEILFQVSMLSRLTKLDVMLMDSLDQQAAGDDLFGMAASTISVITAAAAALRGLKSLKLHAGRIYVAHEDWSQTVLEALHTLPGLNYFGFCGEGSKHFRCEAWPTQVVELDLRHYDVHSDADAELLLSLQRLRKLSVSSILVTEALGVTAANEHLDLWSQRLGLSTARHMRPRIRVLRCQHLVCNYPQLLEGQDAAREGQDEAAMLDLQESLWDIQIQHAFEPLQTMSSPQTLAQLKGTQRRQQFEAQELKLKKIIGQIEALQQQSVQRFAGQLQQQLRALARSSAGREPMSVETVHLGWDGLPEQPTPSITEALIRAWRQLPTKAPAPDLVLWRLQVGDAEAAVIRAHGGFSGLSFSECGGGRGGAGDPDAYNGGFTHWYVRGEGGPPRDRFQEMMTEILQQLLQQAA